MSPSIRKGDLVVYAHGPIRRGEPVIYCVNPSFCVVHRVIEVNGDTIVTKGDNNPAPDPPVKVDKVKGRVVAVLPPYIWVPGLAALLAPGVRDYVRSRDYHLILTLATALVFVLVVFTATDQTYISPPKIYYPSVYLSRASFNSTDCTLTLSYTSTLPMRIEWGFFTVNGAIVRSATMSGETAVLYLPPGLAGRVFQEDGYMVLNASVHFNTNTNVTGSYRIQVFGSPLTIEYLNGRIEIRNPNCFPVNVTIEVHSGRDTVIHTLAVPGHGASTVPVPPASTVRVGYRVWGEMVWRIVQSP